MTLEVKCSGTFTVPSAPLSLGRDLKPHARHKRYSETRPNDFESLREVPARDDLLRLIIGRLLTVDGHDLQDDYTLPIEKEFWHRPLGFIFKHTYCHARGIRDQHAELSVRFMLAEAGSGLGWLDVHKTPVELGLKDTDMVEVLVARSPGAPGAEGGVVGALFESLEEYGGEAAGKTLWSPGSWREAVQLFEETRRAGFAEAELWIPKVWSSLEKHAQDDNVVLPGLALFLSFLRDGPSCEAPAGESRTQRAAGGRDGIGALQRVLVLHGRNCAVQRAGWGLLEELAAEPPLQPLLVQRHGIRSLATRAERAGELDAQALASARRVLESLAGVPGPALGGAAGAPLGPARRPEARASARPRREAEADGLTAQERGRRACEQLAAKMRQALEEGDTLAVDKALRKLLLRIRAREVDSKGVEAALGPLLGRLRSFEGDADVRDLSRQAISATAELRRVDGAGA